MMTKRLLKKLQITAGICCLLSIPLLLWYFFFTGFSNQQNTAYLYVDNNDNVDSVFLKLEPISKRRALIALSTLLRHQEYDRHVKTGRFAIQPSDGVIAVFRKLKNGQQAPVRITIPESRTIAKLSGKLSNKLMIDSIQWSSILSDTSFLKELGYDTCTIMCLFVPNTYEVYWNTSIEGFLERMKKEHDIFWNYERIQKAEAAGLTQNEVCTLASIIDEETANNEEKPMIAGMYINRLAKNMPLQADPTIKFALQDFSIKRIRHGMLTVPSPYNTYINTGLPPGPIKIASIKGIDAVLNYKHHDYLYMCAKEDFSGTHNFAVTYNEHLKNAARYTKALNDRGIN